MAEKSSNVLDNKYSKKKMLELLVIAIVTIVVWNLPTSAFGIDGLTVVQQRVIAIFVFATLSWLTECIPSWATSLTIITTMCLTISNNALLPFKGEESETFGTLLKSKEVMAAFADPVIMLFLGGFILAIAATKSGLDVLLAKNLIRPFGSKSENVLLGFLLITGLFSMFVSNTATAAMMLTFLTPVFAALPANGKGRIALTLSIPVAANIGGMGTPIGTPPNAIAMKVLNDEAGLNMGLGFGEWMAIMFPLTIVILLISWRIILKFFPFTQKTIELEINGKIHHGWRMWVVCLTFIATILLWVIPKDYTGIDANTVAMIPMGVFAVTGVITAKDLKEIDWAVIWMVAGGFALGLGMNGSGLADAAIKSIPFGQWSPLVILFASGLLCYFLSNFISNTATAALLVPILAVVCTGMGDRLSSIGGTPTVLMGIALAASSAMCLPISTPPNAIAYSTGLVKQNDMLKVGLTVGIITMVLGYSLLFAVGKMGLL
jgi:sodium-dependent dicarboxylate transporter 2/3/5